MIIRLKLRNAATLSVFLGRTRAFAMKLTLTLGLLVLMTGCTSPEAEPAPSSGKEAGAPAQRTASGPQLQRVRDRFPSGSPKAEGFVDEKGRRAGKWEEWYDGGPKRSAATYDRDVLEGHYTAWHWKGPLLEEGDYAHGRKTGVWTKFDDAGKATESDEFADGQLNGRHRSWHPNGAIKEEGSYVDGQPEGDWRTWYPQGQPQSLRTYRHGTMQGPATSWWENGQRWTEVRVVDGAREGMFEVWGKDGSVYLQEEYRDGKHVGLTRTWHPNGKPRSIGAMQGDREKDSREGPWFYWSENGDLDSFQTGWYAQDWLIRPLGASESQELMREVQSPK